MRRWVVLLTASVIMALVGYFALAQNGVLSSKHDVEFAFIGKLGGRPHSSEAFKKRDGVAYQFYTFKSDPSAIFDAMKVELGNPAFQDTLKSVVFESNTAHGRVRARLFSFAAQYEAHGGVILSGPPEAIHAIQERYGVEDPTASQEQIYFQRHLDPYIGSSVKISGPNRSNLVLTWYNASDLDYTVTIEEFQDYQFDPLEPLPMTIKVPALSKVPIKFTYPANFDAQQSWEEQWGRFTSTSSEGPGANQLWNMSHPLSITIDPQQGNQRNLVIYPVNDPSGRPIEIKSLKVTLGGQTILAKEEIQKSKPGRGFRIPFVFTGDQKQDRIHITCDFRLWPNQRWRASTDR